MADLSDEELEKALYDAAMESGEVTVRPGTPIDRPEEEAPEPVPEEAQEAAPEPEPEPEAVTEPSAQASEPDAQTKTEPEPSVDDELQKLRESEFEARARHFESVAGRLAGELGFVKQQLKARSASRPQEPDDDVLDRHEPEPRVERTPDSIREWAIQQAIKEAGQQFQSEHPDYAPYMETLKDYIQERGLDPKGLIEGDDPGVVQRRIGALLSEHYWHVRATVDAKRRAELMTRKAEQSQKVTAAKKAASVSASGSAPPPKPKPKSNSEMSDSELEAEMGRATGGRW